MSGWDAELNLPSKLNPPSKLNLPLNQVLGLVLVLGVFVPDWNGFGFAVKKTLNREKQKSQVLPIVALNGIYARALTLKSVSLCQACPLTTVVTEYVMAIGFWFYACKIKRLHEETWGGWDTDEISSSRIREFLRLFLPAAASGASDWWRVTVIGVLAARMGPLQIAVRILKSTRYSDFI